MSHALMQVDHVVIKQANAAGRDCFNKILGLARTVNPVKRVFTILEQIKSARAKRVTRLRIHSTICDRERLQFRSARDHCFGHLPAGSASAKLKTSNALPFECCGPGAAPLAHSAAVVTDQMQETGIGVDHNGAGCLKRKGVVDFLTPELG